MMVWVIKSKKWRPYFWQIDPSSGYPVESKFKYCTKFKTKSESDQYIENVGFEGVESVFYLTIAYPAALASPSDEKQRLGTTIIR